MRIKHSHVLAARDVLHVLQALCALIAACLAIAFIATADATGPPVAFYLALSILSLVALVYQLAVRQRTRFARFANVYAQSALDVLFAILWLIAVVVVATWQARIMRQNTHDGFSSGDPVVGNGEGSTTGTGALIATTTPTGAVTGVPDLVEATSGATTTVADPTEAGPGTSAVVALGTEAIISVSSGIGFTESISPSTSTPTTPFVALSTYETTIAPTSVVDGTWAVPTAVIPTTATDGEDDGDDVDDVDDDVDDLPDGFRIKSKRGLGSSCNILAAGVVTTCHVLRAIVCFAIVICVLFWIVGAVSLYALGTHRRQNMSRPEPQRSTEDGSSPSSEKPNAYPFSPDYYASDNKTDMQEKIVLQHPQELSAAPPLRELEATESLHHKNAMIHEMPDSCPGRENES